MFNIEEIFLHSYPQNNKGIYNCLNLNEANNEVKNIEKETYSIRAEDFKENEILSLSDEENNIIAPLRAFDKKILFFRIKRWQWKICYKINERRVFFNRIRYCRRFSG